MKKASTERNEEPTDRQTWFSLERIANTHEEIIQFKEEHNLYTKNERSVEFIKEEEIITERLGDGIFEDSGRGNSENLGKEDTEKANSEDPKEGNSEDS